jgi:hypothetical protein
MEFFYKYKTIIFLILFLLLSAFIGFILFSLFFRSAIVPGTGTGGLSGGGLPLAGEGSGQIVTPGTEGALPTSTQPDLIPAQVASPVAAGGLTKSTVISEAPGSNYTSNGQGNGIQFYNEEDGKFYTIDNKGNMVTLSDRVFYSVDKVSWSNGKDLAVIEYPDGANIVYDFEKEKSVTLPKHWEDFAFAPSDDKIVAKSIGLDPENRWLTVANVDGSNAKMVEPLGNNADSVYPSWSPNNQSVAMFTEGIDLDRQSLYFLGLNQENFKSTVIEGRGFQSNWAPDGKRLLYSVYSNKNDLKPSLWVVQAQGENIGQGRRSLGIETWANKCTFTNSDNIYCAVPHNLKEGAGLFPELGNYTDDYIYKINITTGQKKLVAIPETEMTITTIVVSEDEKTLFYTDNKSQAARKIDL